MHKHLNRIFDKSKFANQIHNVFDEVDGYADETIVRIVQRKKKKICK